MAQIAHITTPHNSGLGDPLATGFENQNSMNTELYSNKVDKIAGKGLSDTNFTQIEKDKLALLNTSAQPQVQTDWNQTDINAVDYLKNKPEEFLTSVGFLDYADLATQTTPIPFVTGAAKKLTNDALGISTNKNYPPYGITDVWNTVTNRCDFSQLSLGDEVGIRFDVTATTTSANQVIRAYVKIGVGTPTEYQLNIFGQQIKTAQANQFSLFTKLYLGNEDVRTAPAEFYILSDGNGSVKVNGWYFSIIRRGINVVTVEAIVPDTYKSDVIFTGSAITVPSGTKIRNVYLNQVPCYASEWSQSGTTITVATALNGDKITLIN